MIFFPFSNPYILSSIGVSFLHRSGKDTEKETSAAGRLTNGKDHLPSNSLFDCELNRQHTPDLLRVQQ
jgi:hypothetical protein